MKYFGTSDEYFELLEINNTNKNILADKKEGLLGIVWFLEEGSTLIIDTVKFNFKKNEITCITNLHNINPINISKAPFIRFNAPFYCLTNHDSEVGCRGILFFGAKNIPVLTPNEKEVNLLSMVMYVLNFEMLNKDALQLEMLQMMLKRILILCARIYKSQENYDVLDKNQSNIVREFNYLVEQHFRKLHNVSDYAQMLNKAPKTLANLFKKLNNKSPLQFIQNRILLEVKRMLSYTSKPISEIGYEVGFNDIQSFSRFFKNKEGISPSEFRNLKLS